VVAESEHVLARRGARVYGLLGPCHGRGYQVVVGRQLTHRVGVIRVAGEEVCLAAAAAEVLLALRSADTRLLHPSLAAEAIEGL